MTTLYIVCAVLGVPLLAYMVIAGDGDGSSEEGFGDGPVAFVSLAGLAFLLAFFGVGGLLFGALGAGSAVTLAAAGVAGIGGAAIQAVLVQKVKSSSSSSHIEDGDVVGRRAHVVLPIVDGHRGRVVLELAGQRTYLTASLVAQENDGGELEVGSPVVVVAFERGVATVARLDPELA